MFSTKLLCDGHGPNRQLGFLWEKQHTSVSVVTDGNGFTRQTGSFWVSLLGGGMGCQKTAEFPNLEGIPDLGCAEMGWPLVSDVVCYDLWKKYDMPENIIQHSLLVAKVAEALALRAKKRGFYVDVDCTRQSALVHDLGKAYTLKYGGAHAQIGASWVIAETCNYALAQGVLHHVSWPWAITEKVACTLPLIVLYADKRAKHDQCVTLVERENDLLDRYGKTEDQRNLIRPGFVQIQNLEKLLSELLGWEDLACESF